MGKTIKLKKGYDILIQGAAQKVLATKFSPKTYSVKPTDFRGASPIPKLLVAVGDEVRAGDPLFFDKRKPDVMHCAPVSGEIAEIRRGAKRSIAEVVILADNANSYRSIPELSLASASRKELVDHMQANGLWPFIMQRPFGVIANPTEVPKAIFISGFDSAPLSADLNYVVTGLGKYLQEGVNVLKKLTDGKVHLSVNNAVQAANEYTDLQGVELHRFEGKHPAGNVGIQIHHVDAINKNEVVWTVQVQDLIAIGRTYTDWQYNTERLIAVGGPSVKNPQYYKAFHGASISGILKDNLSKENVRVISGNALTGTKTSADGHIGFYDQEVTVLDEGDQYEFLGWLFPSYKRPTISKSFLSGLFGNSKPLNVNTNTHGENRAFVVTGEYEKVLPMDVYPQRLLKSILYKDLDEMEGLGIYEVIEEDLALCEFVCTSKTDVQEILREGLDLMQEQG